MTIKCTDCKKLYEEERGTECCLDGLWDRQEDDWLEQDCDYKGFIEKPRFCSDFSS